MVDEKNIYLMHQEIDGANTEDESAALRSCLADPEAQHYYQELNEFCAHLNKLPVMEPSSGLPYRIVQVLPRDHYAKKTEMHPPLLNGLIEFLRERISYRYTFAFSTGLAAGMVLLFLMNYPKAYNPTDVTGSIGLDPNWKKTEDVTFNDAEVHGEVAIRHDQDKMLIELHVQSTASVEAIVQFDRLHYVFDAFQFSDNSDPGTVQIKASECRITNTGDRRYTILLREISPAAVHFALYASDRMLFQKTFISPGDR